MSQSIKYLLVDGHSVLFQVDEWRQMHQANQSLARERLSQLLQNFQDTSEWLITLVYDGKHGTPQPPEPGKIAILYSTKETTADSIIEKIVAQNRHPSRITVVTSDRAEQQTVESLGALCLSPEWLFSEISNTDTEFRQTLNEVKKKSQW